MAGHAKRKRKIVLNTFLSLDGVMQAPGGPEEDPTGGFVHGGWSVLYWDGMMTGIMNKALAKPFDLLLGRKTYEIFAAHWPFVVQDADKLNAMAADRLNGAHKYVVSRTLTGADWQNTTIIRSDVVNEIAQLKEQEGPEIQVHGSSQLIQALLTNKLIDELGLWIFPVVLGTGKRLFGTGTLPAGLKLAESKVSSTGVVITRYQQAGEILKGSAALETPTAAEIARRKKLREESQISVGQLH
jgi:dihydrofolate reductase